MLKLTRQYDLSTWRLVIEFHLSPRLIRGNLRRILVRWLAQVLTVNDLIQLADRKGYVLRQQPSHPLEDDIPF